MAKIEIYTKAFCSFCYRAKALLDSKGVEYEEIDLTMGGTTVPQIFIDGKHIGGSDDLAALDRQGGLDPLLAA
jgi:glutaredoxin 3